MNRRRFLSAAAGLSAFGQTPLIVPVFRMLDTRADIPPSDVERFSRSIWPEAVDDFRGCGMELKGAEDIGTIGRLGSGRPIFKGLVRGVINVVMTDLIPIVWDQGRGLAGVTVVEDGYHVCLLALRHAHGHHVPFVSVNTCVHELLHALLQDIFQEKPHGFAGRHREFRIDWYATRMWLFHDGAAVRASAAAYLARLRS